mgnify:CR=1 FL=1
MKNGKFIEIDKDGKVKANGKEGVILSIAVAAKEILQSIMNKKGE